MTKKQEEKLVWRLSEKPSVTNILELKIQGLITEEEARSMLFSTSQDQGDTKALKSEINFLRELVEKLSSRVNYYPVWQTINTTPYKHYGWFTTYSSAFGSSQGVAQGIQANTVMNAAGSITNIKLPQYSLK